MECSVAIITVASAKGGVGKSTLSLVVATTLARRGASVAIVDCDPNRNLVTWRAGPSKSTVTVISDVDSSTIARVLRDTASTYQFVIADLEGTASMTVGSATLASDLVVIPRHVEALWTPPRRGGQSPSSRIRAPRSGGPSRSASASRALNLGSPPATRR